MKPAQPCILAINGGSSSIKFALYPVEEPLQRGLHGTIDRIGLGGTKHTGKYGQDISEIRNWKWGIQETAMKASPCK